MGRKYPYESDETAIRVMLARVVSLLALFQKSGSLPLVLASFLHSSQEKH